MADLDFMRRVLPATVGTLLAVLVASAETRAQTLIRDAEIERSLNEIAQPILNAAGLSPDNVKIMVINDSTLNAFIIDGRHIFIHSGLMAKMERPEMLQAVIAHEAAHIANGHVVRRAMNARNARSASGLGLLLSGIFAVTGNLQAAGGLAVGSSGTAQRLFFAHTRDEENAADQAAVQYMARAGTDPSAMADVLEIFRGQEVLAPGRQDPYVRTHPLTRDRLRRVREYAATYGGEKRKAASSDSDYWFARARGKLEAFLGDPARVVRQLRDARADSLTLMQRAVAYHRLPDRKKAAANADALVRARPEDPYVHELKGQILYEARRFESAGQAYARAVELAPQEPLILAGYGRALLALDTRDGNRRGLKVLERSRSQDPVQPRMLRDLAVAYARLGDKGMASLATAERYALVGRLGDAVVHAERASDFLPRGSPGWNRAQDVLVAAGSARRRR